MVFGFPTFEELIQNQNSLRIDIVNTGGGGIADQRRTGLFNFGGETSFLDSRQFETTNIFEGDTIIRDSTIRDFTTRRTTEVVQEQTSTPTISFEKPISLSPAIVGGGSTTATGSAKASSGVDPTVIAFLVIAGGLGFVFLKGFKKPKRK